MGHLVMSDKERLYKGWMVLVAAGQVKLSKAAVEMRVSYRQAKRIWREYQKEGDAGLAHKGRGRVSNHRLECREAVLARYQERYMGFGPTLAVLRVWWSPL